MQANIDHPPVCMGGPGWSILRLSRHETLQDGRPPTVSIRLEGGRSTMGRCDCPRRSCIAAWVAAPDGQRASPQAQPDALPDALPDARRWAKIVPGDRVHTDVRERKKPLRFRSKECKIAWPESRVKWTLGRMSSLASGI